MNLCKEHKYEYSSFSNMRTRCYCGAHRQYKDYGGRGIKVCARWMEPRKGFANFLEDMGDRPEHFTLDRINRDGDYTPKNCRWASRVEQANNTRGNHLLYHEGQTHTISEWARELGIPSYIIYNRISLYKWTAKRAIETPYKRRK